MVYFILVFAVGVGHFVMVIDTVQKSFDLDQKNSNPGFADEQIRNNRCLGCDLGCVQGHFCVSVYLSKMQV